MSGITVQERIRRSVCASINDYSEVETQDFLRGAEAMRQVVEGFTYRTPPQGGGVKEIDGQSTIEDALAQLEEGIEDHG